MAPRILRASADRVALCLLLTSLLLHADGEEALARAKRLSDEGRHDEAIAAARDVLASDAAPDLKARAQYFVAYLLDFWKHDRGAALAEYRAFLANWKHPRLNGIVRARVAEIEAMLSGPDADLLREIEDLSRRFSTIEPRPAIEALRRDLAHRSDSPAVARGWELLGDLSTDMRVRDWGGAIEAYSRAASMSLDAERSARLADKIAHARLEQRRERIYHAGVAALALVLSTTAMLLPRRAGRLRSTRVAGLLLPWAALTATFWALHRLEARDDPENPMTTGRIALFAGLSLVPCLCSALLARSLGRAGRLWVPIASLAAMLGTIAVFCHHFDYFHLFGL